MNKNALWIGSIIVILAIAGIAYANSAKEEDAAMMQQEEAMMEKKNEEAMMEKEKEVMEGEAMMKKGSYVPYSPEKLALANSGDVVLFFHASWCPTCRALDADIKANVIPDGLTILDLDYDTEIALKQKYGVTMQHTLVQVDASGNLIKKWGGSPTLASVVTMVK